LPFSLLWFTCLFLFCGLLAFFSFVVYLPFSLLWFTCLFLSVFSLAFFFTVLSF
jgi:hypothetical protein